MKNRKLIASVFVLIALVLGYIFYLELKFPIDVKAYFKKSFYGQFGSISICVELFASGVNLLIRHSKTNFVLALFGFSAILDPIFNLIGLFSNQVPLYAVILFLCCAVIALRIAFTDAYGTGRISKPEVFGSLLTGIALELFFNAW